MNERLKNPHTFDMNNYYTGQVFVLGGRDFEREEKEYSSKVATSTASENKLPIKLDWSFLGNSKKAKK
jgi:hypothetical protein